MNLCGSVLLKRSFKIAGCKAKVKIIFLLSLIVLLFLCNSRASMFVTLFKLKDSKLPSLPLLSSEMTEQSPIKYSVVDGFFLQSESSTHPAKFDYVRAYIFLQSLYFPYLIPTHFIPRPDQTLVSSSVNTKQIVNVP